ncbi:hypothetical protein [Streptomyces sp. NBC_01669]|uniref:hypothetical protein n=1 Tax=Streptomyces sp. NBC_01669 TaxID=2975909 RepID=UPI0022503D66|nr:hypothetical protein [Streptomyces sp. NBC_01669]MCX4530859.1 hypothetical protein [Streptomyces sp. NBC_01669]
MDQLLGRRTFEQVDRVLQASRPSAVQITAVNWTDHAGRSLATPENGRGAVVTSCSWNASIMRVIAAVALARASSRRLRWRVAVVS